MGKSPSRRLFRLLAGAFAVVALTTANPARATFGPAGFETEEVSAYTLRAQELKIGPAAVRYGLFGQFQLGTHFALNLLGAFNADVKWHITSLEGFALAVESGFTHFDAGFVGVDSDFAVTAIPVKLDLSFAASTRLLFHVRLDYLAASPNGRAPDSVLRLQRLFGPVGKLAGEFFLEWRLNDHFAVLLDYAFPLVMHAPELLYADEAPDDRLAMMRVSGSLLATFDTFNVRLGVGYGPSFLGRAGVFPTLDFFWRVF